MTFIRHPFLLIAVISGSILFAYKPAHAELGSGYIGGETFDDQYVEFSIVDDLAIFEGDIVLGTAEELEDPISGEGVAITGISYRWPNGVVPYVIDPGVNSANINSAMIAWEAVANVDFVERNPVTHSHITDYVRFINNGRCESGVGRRGGIQQTAVGGCSVANMIHEVGHALGLWHEQSREDRNAFIQVNVANVQGCQAGGNPALCTENMANFNQHINDGDDIGAYDYASIMHYSKTAFTNGNGDTITPLYTLPPGVVLGAGQAPSQGDINAMDTLYPLDPYEEARDPGVFANVNSDPRKDYTVVVKTPTGKRNFLVYRAKIDGSGTFFDYQLSSSAGNFVQDGIGRDAGLFADVNGDGRKDYVVIWKDTNGKRNFATYIALLDGHFAEFVNTVSIVSYDVDLLGRDLGMFADVNGDGREDYVVIRKTAPNRYFMTYLANSNGTFQEAVASTTTGWFLADSSGRDVGMFADVNGDGRKDYVVPWKDGANKRLLATYIANSNGTFQEFVSMVSTLSFLADTAGRDKGMFADINGDGRSDYVAVYGTANGKRNFATYLGKTDGLFQPHVSTASIGDYFEDSTGRDKGIFADINGDGRKDYVIAWSSAGSKRNLATHLANSNGTFQEFVNTLSNGNYIPDSKDRDIGMFADVTGDGRSDYIVVWANLGYRSLATYVANSNGTFQEYVNSLSVQSYLRSPLSIFPYSTFLSDLL